MQRAQDGSSNDRRRYSFGLHRGSVEAAPVTSRRLFLRQSVPLIAAVAQLGSATKTAASDSSRTSNLAAGASELKTLQDFGAAGDYDIRTGTGTDDTRAIQRAIDWAYGGGNRPGRAIAVSAANYLCGRITTYPYTTLIGSGRQTSNFICLPGTTGQWWSDRGRGAQKLMLSGLTWYAGGEAGLAAVCEFGTEGTPFGTEGILEGLWMRDAPRGVGLRLNANGGIVRDVTVQACATGIRVNGNGNQIENIIAMENRLGAHLSGSFVRGLHLEATSSGGLPLWINGDCRVRDILISTARGYSFERLIEVDPTNYDEWSLEGIQLLGTDYRVTQGMIAVRGKYLGGTSPNEFTGSTYLPALEIHSRRLALNGQSWQAFSLQIIKLRGRILHRIGTLGNPSLPSSYANRIVGAQHSFSETPVGALAAGGGLEDDRALRFVFDMGAPQDAIEQSVHCTVERSSVGRPLSALTRATRIDLGGSTIDRISIEFFDAATGAPFMLSDLPEGASIQLGLSGFIA